ncbi:MAG: family 78 glycoside hydrolase catalytic domain [Bacteroidetes bacterium]|nr:family 78 glycoside hydrolase catalytic domain [Bacteroidota bacterium]
MKKWFYLILLMLPLQVLAQKPVVNNLRCEYKNDPIGIETGRPRLSWEIQSDGRNVMQTAYRVLVADNPESLNKEIGNVWDSKRVNSSASIQVSYKGSQLKPANAYYWKVKVWGNHGHVSAWSSIAEWRMGLIKSADWHGAKWITYNRMPDSQRIVPFFHGRGPKKLGHVNDTLPLLRKTFVINKPLKSAVIFISGLGHFDLSLNGVKVGDHFLDPGWTQYDKQALYVPFDLTNQLKQGNNTLGVMLGNGFYFIPRDKRYRKLTGGYGYPKMICRLVIVYKDGTHEDIISDGSWKTAPGPVTFSSIYGGEDYNANLEQSGWNTPGFDGSKWRHAIVVDGPPQLNAQLADPVKIFDHFSPVKCIKLGAGKYIYDLGQNASGIPSIKVKGKKGDTVRIIPAELLNEDSTASQKGSGGPMYFDYIVKGDGVETWHPQFTYYGFRYLQVEGAVPETDSNPQNLPVLMEVSGLHIRNAASRIGSFSCSNELFNKTFSLIDWAIQSNMMSVFTDCPHREKLGWLEEVHLMGNSIRYNYDIANLCRKCINDMKLAQTPEGLIPEIAPEYVKFGEPFRDSPEWGSSAVILPWYVYQWYGDKQELSTSYDMIQRYLAYLGKKADRHILTEGLGDWYDIGPNAPGLSQNTPKGITATAIYYYDLNIAAHIAGILGRSNDAKGYSTLAAQVRKAFNDAFFDPKTNEYGTGSQTANAMAVYMKLVEPQHKGAVIANIVKDIRNQGNSLTAGDIGYRYLLQLLDEAGRPDVIFDMNSRSDVPGYGYQLAKGATALTESWQGRSSVSNDHLMLGHIMEWFYGGLAGIKAAPDAIAMDKIELRPEPVGDVTSAKSSYRSPYGVIATDWKKEESKFELTAQIPVNTTATIYLPANKGDHIYKNDKELKVITYQSGKVLVKTGSGTYHFVVKH